jgi:ribosomal protein L37AE/L43A
MHDMVVCSICRRNQWVVERGAVGIWLGMECPRVHVLNGRGYDTAPAQWH